MQNALKTVYEANGIREHLDLLVPGDGFSAGLTCARGAALLPAPVSIYSPQLTNYQRSIP